MYDVSSFQTRNNYLPKKSKSPSSASVMKAMIGIGLRDSREVYIFYREEGVDDQENIRKIMENSCIWVYYDVYVFLEFLSKSWVLYSRKLVSHYRTLSPKIENLEFLSSTPSLNKYIYSVSHFDKGVLKNSRKALFIQYIYMYIYNIYNNIIYLHCRFTGKNLE